MPTPESADKYVDFNFGLFAGEYKYVVGATSSVNAVKSKCTELFQKWTTGLVNFVPLLLTASASTCLKNSLNLGTSF